MIFLIIKVYYKNSNEYLKNTEQKINEYQREISIKNQQIKDGNTEIEYLKNNYDSKQKILLNAQRLIEEKQLQLVVCVYFDQCINYVYLIILLLLYFIVNRTTITCSNFQN